MARLALMILLIGTAVMFSGCPKAPAAETPVPTNDTIVADTVGTDTLLIND